MSNIYHLTDHLTKKQDLGALANTLSYLRRLEIYWHAKRRGKMLPLRSGILASELHPILPYIFLVNYIPRNLMQFNFVGSVAKTYFEELGICDRFMKHFCPDTRSKSTRKHSHAQPQKFNIQPNCISDHSDQCLRLGLFPLLDSEGKPTKAIGSIETLLN